MVRMAKNSKKIHGQVKTFQATIENTKFSVKGSIMALDFLTRIGEEAETLDISKSHKFSILTRTAGE